VTQRRFAGAFERRFELGPDLDVSRLEARLRDGVLTITVPRADSARPRKIALGTVVDKVKGLLGARD
jgi:HSP20 family molecular chaperone IbpA